MTPYLEPEITYPPTHRSFDAAGVIAWLILALIFVGVYVLPIYVASKRKHQQTTAIAVLTIIAGWTFVGWVVAMVWSCIEGTKQGGNA